MTPSTYLLAVPLGLIAVSGWLVKVESDSFSDGKRTSGIQQVPRHASGYARVNANAGVPPAARLDHDRYGWENVGAGEGNLLETDSSRRPLGARPSRAATWVEKQLKALKGAGISSVELPDIPGFTEQEAPADSPFQPVAADGGFHITADEATRVDMGKETVVFNGHVKMTSPQFALSATKLVVHLGKDKKSFKLAEASGAVNVELTGVPEEKKYRGQSATAVYEPAKGTLTLCGWPKIQGQGQELVAAEEGTRVMLFPKTGRMLTEGRAQTRVAKQLMEESPGGR